MSTYSEDSDLLCGSAYEILSDSLLLTDDEDDGGSSIASLDGNSDLSLADSDSVCGQPPSELQDHHPIPSFGGLDEHHLGDSELTLHDGGGGHRFNSEITFEEPYAPEDIFNGEKELSVCHNLFVFNEAETAEVSRHMRFDHENAPATLYSTVRQTMMKSYLLMDEPFRILYIGSPGAKDEISHKLGAALAAVPKFQNCSSSWDTVKSPKFSVVPVSSFGSRSTSPEVELVDNNGPEIILDECTSAKASRNEDIPDDISLWLNGTSNVRSIYGVGGVELESSGWKLPHLAVVYWTESDDLARRMTRVYARSFMARHSVPTLVITQTPQYRNSSAYTHTLDPKSVHICLESDTPEDGHRIHKRIPIDLSSFLALNANQLNRNLGCITGLVTYSESEIASIPIRKKPSPSSKSSNLLLLRDVEKAPHNPRPTKKNKPMWIPYTNRADVWKFFLVGWLFLFMAVGGAITFAYTKYTTSPIPEPEIQPPAATISRASYIVVTPSASSLPSSKNSVSTASSHSHVSVATISPFFPKVEIDSQLYGSKFSALNESDQFQLHVLGKNHFIIRPPQKYLLLKKAPRLFVAITRDGVSIPAELSQLFEGIFDLKVESEEAWGLLNISIRTKSKPFIQETLEVDLGTPWLQVSQWVKAMEQKKSGFQVFLNKTTTDAKDIAADLLESAAEQASDIKDVVTSKARVYSEGVASGLSKLFQDGKKLSQSLGAGAVEAVVDHGEEYIRKAQGQARKIWDTNRRELNEEPQSPAGHDCSRQKNSKKGKGKGNINRKA